MRQRILPKTPGCSLLWYCAFYFAWHSLVSLQVGGGLLLLQDAIHQEDVLCSPGWLHSCQEAQLFCLLKGWYMYSTSMWRSFGNYLWQGVPEKNADFEGYTTALLAWNEAYFLSFFLLERLLKTSQPDKACPSHVYDKIWLHSRQFWFWFWAQNSVTNFFLGRTCTCTAYF